MKIAHISDIQIRFGSRHDEYKQVFQRLYDDLKKEKPSRIVVTGDLNHHKINMSPKSVDLAGEFLINLSNIAPVDIIAGNHDLNILHVEQGDAIASLVKLLPDGEIITSENKSEIDFWSKGVFYFPYTDYYDIGKDIVYGVYSCIDGKTLTLKKKEKEKNKSYIALYHGTIFGSMMDNLYKLREDDLLKIEAFDNFDVVMLGDIHEYQTFREDESAAFAGSLIQQNFGEGLDKGYLIWDINDKSHERRFILNDYGYYQLHISRGESIEDRLSTLKFSNDKKKTKIKIIIEDYRENYSVEKERQIKQLIKKKFGCELVTVDTSILERQINDSEENEIEEKKEFDELLLEFIDNGDFNCSPEEKNEIFELSKKIDEELEIKEREENKNYWSVDGMEVSNFLSFPEEVSYIPFDRLRGLTGVFGENYCGKSNLMKALVWGLFQIEVGKRGKEAGRLVNMYTNKDTGYVKVFLTINGNKFFIKRSVTTSFSKNKISNSYSIEYRKKLIEEGKEIWAKDISDKGTTIQGEVQKQIIEALGSAEDFMKVSFQSQDGDTDFLYGKQQEKNDLIRKFLGLENFDERYDYANVYFKKIKDKQSAFEEKEHIEENIKNISYQIEEEEKRVKSLTLELEKEDDRKETLEKDRLNKTSKLEKIENLEYSDKSKLNTIIENETNSLNELIEESKKLEIWLSNNHIKELNFDPNLNLNQLNNNLITERKIFQDEKNKFLDLDAWIKKNPKMLHINYSEQEGIIQNLKLEILQLEGKLKIFKGEKCSYCGSTTKKPDPEKAQQCINDIQLKNNLIESNISTVQEGKRIENHNNLFDLKISQLENLKLSLQNRKIKIEQIKQNITIIENSQDVIEHNKLIENNNKLLFNIKNSINKKEAELKILSDNLLKIDDNVKKIEKNEKIKSEITSIEEDLRSIKLIMFNINNQLTEAKGNIRVFNSKKDDLHQKIEDINKIEKEYRKYSIYLQAVHRDGIPAMIVARKLPIINNKVNSILNEIVDFKVNLKINKKGDVSEYFYVMENQKDELPLTSASGSQKFITSLAIKDALHYISNISRPSLFLIDEGFGTLDDNHISEIGNVIEYLSDKYENILITTHRNEIKDYVDNVIQVSASKNGLADEYISNPKIFVSSISVS